MLAQLRSLSIGTQPTGLMLSVDFSVKAGDAIAAIPLVDLLEDRALKFPVQIIFQYFCPPPRARGADIV